MPVEFLGIAATNDGSEIPARSGASFDKDYTLRLARAHEENGWDRVLFAYGSGSPAPNPAAAANASNPAPLQLLPDPPRGVHREQRRPAAAAARPPAERRLPDVRGEDLRHHRPDQRRPGDRA